jgi:hypothetical protein
MNIVTSWFIYMLLIDISLIYQTRGGAPYNNTSPSTGKRKHTAPQTTALVVVVALLLLAPNLLMQILPGLLVALAGGCEGFHQQRWW